MNKTIKKNATKGNKTATKGNTKKGIKVSRAVAPKGKPTSMANVWTTEHSGVYIAKKGQTVYQIQRFAGGRLLADGTYQPNENRKTLSTRFEVYRKAKNGSLTYIETVKNLNKVFEKYGLN